MRKLIGHSGPVYSLSFDPIYGSASSPQALLSGSQDGTVRLWSLDTYSNLVVYRGHGRDPVWDVEWGPMGVYFATASRDRTARLWSSDRVTPLRMYTGHLSDVNVSHSFDPIDPRHWLKGETDRSPVREIPSKLAILGQWLQ
jgi:transcription initiation factor TFIID subunit 5